MNSQLFLLIGLMINLVIHGDNRVIVQNNSFDDFLDNAGYCYNHVEKAVKSLHSAQTGSYSYYISDARFHIAEAIKYYNRSESTGRSLAKDLSLIGCDRSSSSILQSLSGLKQMKIELKAAEFIYLEADNASNPYFVQRKHNEASDNILAAFRNVRSAGSHVTDAVSYLKDCTD